MYEIRPISRHEFTWLRTADFQRLFAQLTTSVLIDEDAFERWFREVQANPCFTLFGVLGSERGVPGTSLVGVGCLWCHSSYYRGLCKSGHIEDVVIDQHHRGTGLGKLLVGRILRHASELGCYKVQLHCTPEERSFYEGLGMSNRHLSMSLAVATSSNTAA